jgi:hypothetical protein
VTLMERRSTPLAAGTTNEIEGKYLESRVVCVAVPIRGQAQEFAPNRA